MDSMGKLGNQRIGMEQSEDRAREIVEIDPPCLVHDMTQQRTTTPVERHCHVQEVLGKLHNFPNLVLQVDAESTLIQHSDAIKRPFHRFRP